MEHRDERLRFGVIRSTRFSSALLNIPQKTDSLQSSPFESKEIINPPSPLIANLKQKVKVIKFIFYKIFLIILKGLKTTFPSLTN